MAIIRVAWPNWRAAVNRPREIDPALLEDRMASLASWMMLLGTIGFTCALGDYARNSVQYIRYSGSGFGFWKFVEANNPLMLFTSAWPFLLGLALYRTRWRQWLAAAAITFFILSLGGLIDLTAAWNRFRETSLPVGSFRVAMAELQRFSPSAVLLLLLGLAQIMAQLAIALDTLRLLFRSSDPARLVDSQNRLLSRRAQLGRIGVYLSLAFLALTVRIPVWAAYVEVLNRSRFVREYILHNDLDRVRSERAAEQRMLPRSPASNLRSLLDDAIHAWNQDRYSDAKDTYIALIGMGDSMGQTIPDAGRGMVALGLNNLAWLLATCPDKSLRNPADAVKYAARAVEMSDTDGNTWNTLGVARLKNGDIKGSREALMRSITIRRGGDAFDWFYLAILDAREGNLDSARTHYQQASDWYHHTRPTDPELYEIQSEAAAELKLPKPPKPARPVPTKSPPHSKAEARFRARQSAHGRVPGL